MVHGVWFSLSVIFGMLMSVLLLRHMFIYALQAARDDEMNRAAALKRLKRGRFIRYGLMILFLAAVSRQGAYCVLGAGAGLLSVKFALFAEGFTERFLIRTEAVS